METSSNSESIYDQIRCQFLKNINEDAPSLIKGEARKFLNNENLLLRFYNHQKHDVMNAAKMLERFLKWRKSFGLDKLTNKDVSEGFKSRGAIYLNGFSKEGYQILWIHIKKLRQGVDLEDSKKSFILAIEKILWDKSQDYRAKVCIVVDMVGAGLSNLDMPLSKFLITMLQNIYPELPQIIIPFHMPFYFKAAWNVMKSWLSPEALQVIKFCNSKEIKKFIEDSHIPVHMGGKRTSENSYKVVDINDKNDSRSKDSSQSNLSVASSNKSPRSPSIDSNIESIKTRMVFPKKKFVSKPGAVEVMEFSPTFMRKSKRSLTLMCPPSNEGSLDGLDELEKEVDENHDTKFHNLASTYSNKTALTAYEDIQSRTNSEDNPADRSSLLRLEKQPKNGLIESRSPRNVNCNVTLGRYVSVSPSLIDLTFSNSTSFVIRNHTLHPVAFKLKLTNTEFIKLDPVSGILEFPDSFLDVKVAQLRIDTLPPEIVKMKVVTTALTDESNIAHFKKNPVEFWKRVNLEDLDGPIVRLKLHQVNERSLSFKSADKPDTCSNTDKNFAELKNELDRMSTKLTQLANQNNDIVELLSSNQERIAQIHKLLHIVSSLSFIFIIIILTNRMFY